MIRIVNNHLVWRIFVFSFLICMIGACKKGDVFSANAPNCNTKSSFYDLEGNVVELSIDEQHQILNERELVRAIWECGQ